jgi:hypothetical protein
MATYLVLKRTMLDWVALPGELLIDPVDQGILMARGFITPVPDNYPGAVSSPPPPREEVGASEGAGPMLEQEDTPPSTADSPFTAEEPEPAAEESKPLAVARSKATKLKQQPAKSRAIVSRPMPKAAGRPLVRARH